MNRQFSLVDPSVDTRWDACVGQHPDGVIYHHSGWGKVLQETYGYQPLHLAVQGPDPQTLAGIMPWGLARRGRRAALVSVPFAAYCPCLLPPAALPDAVAFMRERHPDVARIELRLLDDRGDSVGGSARRADYVTHFLDLAPGPEQLFRACHESSIRQRIRRAEKLGLAFRTADSETDLRRFYTLETSVRRKHGLPPQPFAFFRNLSHAFAPLGHMHLGVVEQEGRVVAAAVLLNLNGVYHLEYSATDARFMRLGANQKLIWECIRLACDNGGRRFDFGRSSLQNASLIEFKERWGAVRRNLYYYGASGAHDDRAGVATRLAHFVNRRLPARLLQWEGELVYRAGA